MKLCALSPFSSSSKSDILDFIGKTAFGLIVLPGAADNMPSPREIQRVLRRGVRVFVELKRTGKKGQKKKAKSVPYLVTHDEIVRMPHHVFGANPSAQEEMDQLGL